MHCNERGRVETRYCAIVCDDKESGWGAPKNRVFVQNSIDVCTNASNGNEYLV